MLKLTKKADYGLIALKHLTVRAWMASAAGTPGVSASANEIAETYGIPQALLSKILQKLARAGFLQSEHGTNGGYRLARDPEEITTLEVIREIDGPIILTACFTEHGECSHTDRCNVREPLRKVHEGILRLLSSISIAEMSREDARVPGLDAPQPQARLYALEAGLPKQEKIC